MLDKRINIAFLPTPIHKLKNLSKKYGSYNLFIKRDDQTGLASGGNKTRKLDYLLYHAIDQQCDCVITAGAQQSNHCRQTAAACAHVGLECHLLLGGDQPKEFAGNLLLSKLTGAVIHYTGKHRKGEDIERVKKELIETGKKPYVIPYGGSNLIGALGFANAVLELKKQIDDNGIRIDYIFYASSSGGTQAGMILGRMMSGLQSKFMPIFIDKSQDEIELQSHIRKLVQEGKQVLNISETPDQEDTQIIRGYDNAGYGVVTDNERYAIKTLAEHEGIFLDPVYTGRAFYGMIDHLERKLIHEGSNVLFWHTGGFPALFSLQL